MKKKNIIIARVSVLPKQQPLRGLIAAIYEYQTRNEILGELTGFLGPLVTYSNDNCCWPAYNIGYLVLLRETLGEKKTDGIHTTNSKESC